MELRLLKYFLAVAREQNISKAAIFLNTTQPNLSRQMQMLEDEIGKPLFTRNNRRIVLTETGLLLRKRAEEIIALTEQTYQEIKDINSKQIAGQINIGAGESINLSIISKTIKQIQTKYPKIVFNFYSGDTNEIANKLDAGLIDFGVLFEPYDLEKYNHIPLPKADIWGILMHKDMELANKKEITFSDLWDKPLLISRHSNDNNFITNYLGKNINELNIVATYNLIYNASLLVKEKVGYALTLENLLNIENTDIIYKRLSPLLTSKLHIAWKKYVLLTKPIELFLDCLEKNILEETKNDKT